MFQHKEKAVDLQKTTDLALCLQHLWDKFIPYRHNIVPLSI